MQLWSGAQDGAVHAWDMRAQALAASCADSPGQHILTRPFSSICLMRAKKHVPGERWACQGSTACTWAAGTLLCDTTIECFLSQMQRGPVKSLGLVTEHCLQSGSGDGVLSLWDVRSPTQPLRSLQAPDSG